MSSFAAPAPRARPPPSKSPIEDDDDDADVAVVGYSCNIYRDDPTASFIDAGEHLLLWNDNKQEDLWIDRYDCRLLLDDVSTFSRRTRSPVAPQGEEMEKILDAERYRFLPSESEQEAPAETKAEHVEEQRSSDAQYGQVHFSFGSEQTHQPQQQPEPSADMPPEIVELATQLGLRSDCSLPRTRKQHQAIEKTAKFVLKQGQKMEAMLKVKHGGNPAFGFLLVDNPLQAYYQALLAHFRANPAEAEKTTILPDELPAVSEAAAADGQGEEPATSTGGGGGGGGGGGAVDQGVPTETPVNGVAGGAESAGTGGTAGVSTVGVGVVTGQQAPGGGGAGPMRAFPVKPDDAEMAKAIEKLVAWVLKSGRGFEDKVRERQRGDKRFDFLRPWNPYNAYYLWRLEQAEKERDAAGEAGVKAEAGEEKAERGEKAAEATEGAGEGEVTEEGRAGAERHEYDPHAITTVEAITSFGGSESEEEAHKEEEAGGDDADSNVANGQDDQGVGGAGGGGAEEGGKTSAKTAEAIRDAVTKATRLHRAKLLAAKLEVEEEEGTKAGDGGKEKEGEGELLRRSRSRSGSERRRSRSKSRSRSRSKGRRRERSRERDRGSEVSRHRHRRERVLRRRGRSNSRSRSRGKGRRRSRSRSRSRERVRRRSGSRERKSRSRERKSRSRERKGKDRERKSRRRSPSRSRSKSRSRSRSRSTKRRKGEGAASAEAGISGAAPGGEEAESVVVSDALRDKVRAMLAGTV